jgi:hypothetical protein
MARRRPHNWRGRPRGSTTARGYGSTHQGTRKRWELVVESGHAVCVRCDLPILPGTPFHLDHDDDRIHYLGVSHAACNLRAASKRGNEIKRQNETLAWLRDSPRRASRKW